MSRLWHSLVVSLATVIGFPAAGEPLRVAAAASMRDVITALAHVYEASTDEKISTLFQASSTIARQIQAGGRIDLFIAADDQTMGKLVDDKLIDKKTLRIVASNELVFVVAANERWMWVKSLDDLLDARIGKIAICDAAVPAGHYARLWLQQHGTGLDALRGKIVKPDHVRAALSMVSAGVAHAGFVYRTDAATQKENVRIVLTVKQPGGRSIIYPAAVVAASQKQAAAQKFLTFLRDDPRAQQQFLDHGFLSPPAAAD